MSGATAYVFSTRDVVTSWRRGKFFDSHAWGFGFNPGGASNSLPLWENNSCFSFLASYLFWREITHVLGYNTANKQKSVFYFLAKFLFGQVFSNQTHSLSIHRYFIKWNLFTCEETYSVYHSSHHPEKCDGSSLWTSAEDETDVLMFWKHLHRSKYKKHIFNFFISINRTALKDMWGSKFFTSGYWL